MKKQILPFIFLVFTFFTSCKMADLRTFPVKELGISTEASKQGRRILEAAQKAQGLDRLEKYTVYQVIATDQWRGLGGSFGKPWPQKVSTLQFQYQINSFNSKATFLDGKKKGSIIGLQDWNYYEQDQAGNTTFPKTNKKYNFFLPALQYFMELPNRLLEAPIILYAGAKNFNGKAYELVLVTWNQVEPHKEHDQYLAWVNKESQLIEYCEYTIRDNVVKFPGSGSLYGSIFFSDYQNINGILIPFEQKVFVNSPKTNTDKYLHQLSIQSFQLDNFDLSELYPNPELSPKSK